MQPFRNIMLALSLGTLLLALSCNNNGSITPEATTTSSPPTPTITPIAPTDTPPNPTPSTATLGYDPTPTPTLFLPTPTPIIFSRPLPNGTQGGRITTIATASFAGLDVHREVQETLTSLGPGIAYSRLLRLATGADQDLPQPSLLIECDLCESWEMVDPITYRFELRKNVLWQDISPVNGRNLVADDIVFSLNRQRTEGWANAALLNNISGIGSEGQYGIVISLNKDFPDADFMVSLANGHTKIVAEEAVALNGNLHNGPVIGTGPWIWDSVHSAPDIGYVFSKNPTYFEKGLPFLDELVIKVIKGGPQVQLAAFVTGEVDVYRVTPDMWETLKGTGKTFGEVLVKQGGHGLALTMNVSLPPFNDPDLRRAAFLALDPWDYVDTIWKGQGFVSVGLPVRDPSWLISNTEMRARYFANPSIARDIVDDGQSKFTLTIADFGDIYLQQGQKLAEDLKSVGFDPIIKVVNPPQYTESVWRDKDYQMALGVLPPAATTNSLLFAGLHSLGIWNVTAHSNTKLDNLIDRQSIEMDQEKRRNLIREIQWLILDQAYMVSPVTGTVGQGTRWVFSPKVQGFNPNTSISEYIFWARTWVK